MTFWRDNNPVSLPLTQARRRNARAALVRALAAASLAVWTLGLTGCFGVHRVAVSRTVRVTDVMDATLDQLNSRMASEYKGIQTINAKVTIKASTGGHHEGEVQEIPSFSGYMLMRKPNDLRVIMELPVVGSLALDMASDGKTFRLLIPQKKIAREGSETVTTPSPKGFENLRPNIIREALLVPPVGANESVSRTQNARILPPAAGKKDSTEEPDYDLTVTRPKSGNELETVRVIHISRVTLLPYEQDIYNPAGQLVTIVTYDHYQKQGDVDFPMSILITRPIDEYALQIDVTRLTLNQAMDDEQFVLKFPENLPVQKMQ